MEGDGMIAIVQGLRDAGLTVTLVKKLAPRSYAVPVSKSSVETNTATCGRNQAAQVRDDHYTSSYQVAHCSAKPTSPPQRLPEFPPQRFEPSRDHGNFQVGGHGSGYEYIPPRPSPSYRGGMWPERGSYYSGRISPPLDPSSDPFVHSLRRYPLPPERSESAEIVQRLLNYTQQKYSSKNPNSRSVRSFREEVPTKDQKTDTTSTKNVQTYTRAKRESRDHGANTNNEIQFSFGKKGKSFDATSPYLRPKRSYKNESYDYLRPSTSRRFARHPEVRYLNDVKKVIRDTIKQICEDKPLVCPRIRSRFDRHQRTHHGNPSQDSCTSPQCAEAQASSSFSIELPGFSCCQPPTAMPSSPNECDQCKISTPCACQSTSPEPSPSFELAPEPEESCCDCMESRNKIEEIILNWLKGIPVYADDSPKNKSKREEMVMDLADKLKSLEADRDYQKKAKKEILECIDKLPMWYPGDKNEQEMFKNKIADDLFNRLKMSDDFKEVILNSLDDVEFEPGENVDKEEIVDMMVDRLKPIASDPDEMKSEIKDLLQELPIKDKEKVINKLADRLANNLTGVAKVNKSRKSFVDKQNDYENPIWGPKIDKNLEKPISNEISDLIDDIPSSIIESKKNEIKNKVANILAENIDNLSGKNDNINREIVKILRKEGNMSEDEASDLASALINRVKGMPLSTQPRLFISDKDLLKLASEEVSDILDEYSINAKKREEIEKNIADLLADQIVRGTDDSKIKNNILSSLKDADVSDEDADDITNRLMEKNKELSLSFKSQDSKQGINKSRLSKSQYMSLIEKENFGTKTESEILDFIKNLTGNDSPNARINQKRAAEQLAHRLGRISDPREMSDPDDTGKEKSMNEEISKYLEKLLVDSNSSTEEVAKTLADWTDKNGFQASTPKKGGSFYPRRISTDIASIYNDNDDSAQEFKKIPVKSDAEKDYEKDLVNVIQSWVNDLSIDLSATEDKGFKETMNKDLAGDIVDRQKYLQLNPNAKKSDHEELEHLKYQIFRWLNKLQDVDDMSSIMQKTKTLMDKIKNIEVPELAKPTRKFAKAQGVIPVSLDSIKKKLSQLMEDIPNNLYKSTDKNFHKQMIDELANKLQKLRANNDIHKIDEEITNWLGKMTKNIDRQELTNLTEDLKTRLKQKATPDTSFMLSQDSGEFVEENLIGGIQDWLKNLPLYLKRNALEKREQESLIPELAKGLKSIFETAQGPDVDSDKLFIDEITKHLKKFPMDPTQRSDEGFLQRFAAQLLHYLKGLQMFQNVSERRDRQPDEYLKVNMDDWLGSLPLTRMDSKEAINYKNLIQELTDKVKQIRQQDPTDEQKLRDEIRNNLIKFPFEEDVKRDQKFINYKIEELLNNLSVVPIETQRRKISNTSDMPVNNAVGKKTKLLPLEKRKTVNDDLVNKVKDLLIQADKIKTSDIKKAAPIKKAADILLDDIESWCDSLPLRGNTPEEIQKVKKTKQEVASKLIHKIGEFNMNPEIYNDDFLYDEMLEDEIDNLHADLSSEDVRKNLPALKKDLMEKVKKARQKTQEETAGNAYKQQLREAISKKLPPQSLDQEERASFEVLKDSLADAFITLHVVGDDESLKNKYKDIISDVITKFSNDYLKKHPESPIDGKKLNQDLYNALKGVPIPKEETVRKEVELVKIKDQVNECVNEIPLKPQTATEKMQTNKMIAVLSKKIHDIEQQKKLVPDANYDNIMRKEITKWVKKLPTDLADADINKLADKLIDNLKRTESSRIVGASTKHFIEPDSFDIEPAEQLSDAEKSRRTNASNRHSLKPESLDKAPAQQPPQACKPTCPGLCKSQFLVPPSTLSFEDRGHLQRIKERSPTPKLRYPPSKDASVSPLPVDAGSQTEITPWETYQPSSRQQSFGIQKLRSPAQKTMPAVGSQAEVSPHVVVKEYYWDTMDPSRTSGPCAPCPSQFTQCVSPPQGPSPPRNQLASGPSMTQISGVSQQPSPYSDQDHCAPCPNISPQTSIRGAGCAPKPQPRLRREQPCYRREMPGVSSEDHPEPGTSRSFRTPKAKVTRLGSFDEMGPRCQSRHDWKFPEENEFWGGTRFTSDDDEPFLKERKKEEEKTKCRCRERILTRCSGRSRGRGFHSTPLKCPSIDEMRNCSKCCGAHCPYPSYLYFRQ